MQHRLRQLVQRGIVVLIASGVIASGALSCSGTRGSATGPVIRDSAGVRIVAYDQRAWEVAPKQWQVSEGRTPAIGGADTGAHALLGVRNVTRLPNGDLVVASSRTSQVVVFDSTGGLVRTIGRRGAGPGEFTGLIFAKIVDGSIVAYDQFQRRVTRFALTGEVLETVPTTLGFVRHVFGDGSILATYPRMPDPQSGVLRGEAILLRQRSGQQLVDTIGRFPDSEIVFNPAFNFVGEPLPFGRRLQLSYNDSMTFLSTGEALEIRSLSPAGDVKRIVRVDLAPTEVSAEDFDGYIATQLVDASPTRKGLLEWLRTERLHAKVFPQHGALLAGPDGELWVESYRRSPDTPRQWRMLDSVGRVGGTIEVPRGFTMMNVGKDWVAGVQEGESGVERVVVLKLGRM